MMKALETSFMGCRFRSRLEARWAVFFQALGVPWEHEPEGWETDFGPYLPDFRITLAGGKRRWFEVKPNDSEGWDPRWNSVEGLLVSFGLPAWDKLDPRDQPGEWGLLTDGEGNCSMAFTVCHGCGAVGVTRLGRACEVCARGCMHPNGWGRGPCVIDPQHERVVKAYEVARVARFGT